MSIKRIKKEYRETAQKEIVISIIENALYGFLGAVIVVFISKGVDLLVLIGYMSYYFFLSRVLNRPKYVTHLGRFILFPIPTALGAFGGYKLAQLMSIWLN
jgi:hypothetical protein